MLLSGCAHETGYASDVGGLGLTFSREPSITLDLSGACRYIGSRPSDHYFRSVCLFVCLSVCLIVCAEFFSAVVDPISIKLGHMLYVWV